MRELKFRGKRLDNGEWLYGDICHHDGVVSYIGQDERDGRMIVEDLVPETVGQYTGLKDKNGTEIYEGDIVRVFQPFNVPTKAIVELNDGCFELKGIELTWRDYVKCFVVNHAIEIIGNIHDNPELVEEELK